MDAMRFEQFVREDPQLRAFLQGVADEVGKQVPIEEPKRYLDVTATGVSMLFNIAVYTLFRLVKDYFDHRRALNEVEVLKRQTEVIRTLVEEAGFPRELAQATVVALLTGIAKRTKDDPVLKKAFDLVGKGE